MKSMACHQRRNKVEQGIEWLYIKTFSIGENVASAIFLDRFEKCARKFSKHVKIYGL